MPFPPSSPPVLRALAERGYSEPTPVQSAVLDPAAAGRDLLVSAQTGSGKTVAYGLAFASTLLGDSERLDAAADPLALVIAPTRELALQVHGELSWLYQYAGGRIAACVGGMDPRREKRQLAEGAHIVVGTPGRLRDHLERGHVAPSALRAVVLDEADEMLDLGFREDLEFILQAVPAERQTLLFSATLPKPIIALAKSVQRHALRLEVRAGEGGHADIEYRAVRVQPREVAHAVVNTLRQIEAPIALVFCNTRQEVRHLQGLLLERGFSAVALSGELSQAERNQALQALRDRRARVCIATDVAARGIDLPGLDLVIHADLPHDAEVLQHRSGRTGRAGRKGISVLLTPPSRRRRAEQLMASAGIEAVWAGPPTADEIRRLDGERLVGDPVFERESGEEDGEVANILLARHSPERIAAAFARLYRQRLPAPEDVSDPGFAEPGPRRRPDAGAPRDGSKDQPSWEGGTWFRLNVGRANNADPKWLLPMLCRRGGVSRQDIGAIRIFPSETKVQISRQAAEGFAETVRGTETGGIRIEPMAGPARPGTNAKGPAKSRGERDKTVKAARPGAWGKARRGQRAG